MDWITHRLGGLLPLALAVLAGLTLAVGLRRFGERAGHRAAELEQRTRERANAQAQARAAAAYLRVGAAERLRRGKF